VVGSDVVWNGNAFPTGVDPVFFGKLPCDWQGSWIAYAPSIGDASSESPDYELLRASLRSFCRLSARDYATQDLTEKLVGHRPHLVVDPVLLSGLNSPTQPPPQNTLLVYCHFDLHRYRPHLLRQLKAYAVEQGQSLQAIGYYQKGLRNIFPPDCEGWESRLAASGTLITSTFHGLIYAIKCGINCFFVESPSVMSKVAPYLDRFVPMSHRVSPEAGFLDLDRKIPWATHRNVLDSWIAESKAYLSAALQG
jgi:hypothetical protein